VLWGRGASFDRICAGTRRSYRTLTLPLGPLRNRSRAYAPCRTDPPRARLAGGASAASGAGVAGFAVAVFVAAWLAVFGGSSAGQASSKSPKPSSGTGAAAQAPADRQTGAPAPAPVTSHQS
jgi:hypothetical protein